MACKRCLIAGRVQGVFFRASTREQALQLGISGYARNLPDGRVEVVACGPQARVERLCAWLRTGPPQAAVSDCACEDLGAQSCDGFSIS